MKLNVIFIKGKSLIFMSCFFIILFSFLFINKFHKNIDANIPTMVKPQVEEYLKYDLNGDTKDDLLYISCKDDIYYIEAHINDKTYFFNTKNSNTLGSYSESWPLSIKLINLNNDNVPEILTESSLGATPTIHIFMLHNNEFKDIFCSTNNFLGVLNSSDLDSPVLISSPINTLSKDLNAYVLDSSLLKKTPINNLSLQNLNIIDNIISFIESNENKYNMISEFFSANIPASELSLLQNLKDDGYDYIFQNCFLESTNTSLSSSIYTLVFKKYDKYESSKFTLDIYIDKINDTFLITSIK